MLSRFAPVNILRALIRSRNEYDTTLALFSKKTQNPVHMYIPKNPTGTVLFTLVERDTESRYFLHLFVRYRCKRGHKRYIQQW